MCRRLFTRFSIGTAPSSANSLRPYLCSTRLALRPARLLSPCLAMRRCSVLNHSKPMMPAISLMESVHGESMVALKNAVVSFDASAP